MTELTEKHFEAMTDVAYGADVYAYWKALLLREVEAIRPEYIVITEAKFPPPGEQQQPYFGAYLTQDGFDAAGVAV